MNDFSISIQYKPRPHLIQKQQHKLYIFMNNPAAPNKLFSRTPSQILITNMPQQNTNSSEKLIDLKLTFGDDGGQDQLLELSANFCSFSSSDISQKQRQVLRQIQSKQDVSNDTLLVLRFQVETGRQRQSLQFIEKGLDQDKSNQNTSAMQKLFHRPKTTGRIQLKQGKGYVYVIYRFYEQMIEDRIGDVLKFIQSQIDINFQLNMIMKGTTEQSKRSFTAVKPDYFQLQLQSQKLSLTDFLNFLQSDNQIPQQQLITEYYQLLKNLEIAQFDLKFNSVRQIMRYYNRCLYGDNGEDERGYYSYRELPLLNKGIFKNSVRVNAILANKLAMEVDVRYKSEEVMLRLIARFVKMYDQR